MQGSYIERAYAFSVALLALAAALVYLLDAGLDAGLIDKVVKILR